jgi:hypothetical protein
MVLCVVLLTTQPSFACDPCAPSFLKHVTLADPASYRLVYTGIRGLLFDEYVKFIGTKWREDISYMYATDEVELSYRLNYAIDVIRDYNDDKYADKRKHWWHYSRHWNWTRTYTTGPSRDVINVGPFRVSNKFKFKLKSYRADISSKWAFKFKPRVSFTSKLPLIKTAMVQFVFTYSEKQKRTLRFTISAGANLKRMDGEVSFNIDFLGWGS